MEVGGITTNGGRHGRGNDRCKGLVPDWQFEATVVGTEIVEIATGEVALFWDTAPAQTGRLSRALKTDLAQLEADAFVRRWRRWEGP